MSELLAQPTRFESDPRFTPSETQRRTLHGKQLLALDGVRDLPEDVLGQLHAIVSVLPFKVNGYVIENLIDWDHFRDDPIYQLTFPQAGMLSAEEQRYLLDNPGHAQAAGDQTLDVLGGDPGGQMEKNVPVFNGEPLTGLQHKYADTVLVFPSTGQTCHSYCAYCFRWPQFLPKLGLRHSIRDVRPAVEYVRSMPDVTDLLFTGGDAMIMTTDRLRQWVDPFLESCRQVRNIRFGTKAISYWPYKFTEDTSMIDYIAEIIATGRSVNFMAHISHPKEMSTDVFAEAVARIRGAGAIIRSQAPLTKNINDDPRVWAEMWEQQVLLGIMPYYMFVARPTGNHAYFSVPLARCLEIYQEAVSLVSGLSRTARGPVMSCDDGKMMIEGTTIVGGEKYFVMRFLQARDPQDLGALRFYKYDPEAMWVDDLEEGRVG